MQLAIASQSFDDRAREVDLDIPREPCYVKCNASEPSSDSFLDALLDEHVPMDLEMSGGCDWLGTWISFVCSDSRAATRPGCIPTALLAFRPFPRFHRFATMLAERL